MVFSRKVEVCLSCWSGQSAMGKDEPLGLQLETSRQTAVGLPNQLARALVFQAF